MTPTTEIEVWVVVDADGDYFVAKSREDAVGEADATIEHRSYRVSLVVPTPRPVELSGAVGEEKTPATGLTVNAA